MGAIRKVSHVPAQDTTRETSRATTPTRRALSPFDEMDRMFSRMMGRSFPRGWFEPMRSEWPALEEQLPHVDVIDRDREILVRAEVPGIAREDLEVTMSGNTVTFRGTRRHEEEREEGEYHYRETSRGEFCRTLTLPADVDGDHAKATYRDGMVELVLPKREVAQRRKVEVEAG